MRICFLFPLSLFSHCAATDLRLSLAPRGWDDEMAITMVLCSSSFLSSFFLSSTFYEPIETRGRGCEVGEDAPRWEVAGTTTDVSSTIISFAMSRSRVVAKRVAVTMVGDQVEGSAEQLRIGVAFVVSPNCFPFLAILPISTNRRSTLSLSTSRHRYPKFSNCSSNLHED